MKRILSNQWKSETPLYHIWEGMKERCLNPNAHNYSMYGGSGVSIYKPWVDSFSEFEKWALENGYEEGLTIDRKDNDKGYSPDNCRWVTYKEQARNRRSNHKITYKGETFCIAEWADRYGLPYYTLISRIYCGWEFERALTTPVRAYKKEGLR